MSDDFISIRRREILQKSIYYVTKRGKVRKHPLHCRGCKVTWNPYTLPYTYCRNCAFIRCEKCARTLDEVDYSVHELVAYATGELIKGSPATTYRVDVKRSKRYYGRSAELCGL
jgi:hypothetical protein